MLKVGDMALNTKTRTLYCNGDTIALTRIEARLLESLMRRPGQVVSAKTLMKEVWRTDFVGDLGTLYVYISSLRRKIGRGKIVTQRRRGYALKSGEGGAEV
jgi:DNA-binding response OmpR family regulator